MSDPLGMWNPGPAKDDILRFVDAAEEVPVADRMAVLDVDGTLWCEKPMPIQLDFILRRLVEMGAEDPDLRARQPWKAACEGDHAWFSSTMDRHYAGDDTLVEVLAAGILRAFGDITVEAFEDTAAHFLRTARHPTLDRGYLGCTYAPMVQLLDLLTAHGFATYLVSGGGRDFMRPVSQELFGVPRERVVGSSTGLRYVADGHGGTVMRTVAVDYVDDGAQKPVRIWSRTGRRPIFAAGNSNGDVPMLDYSQHPDTPSLQLLVSHDDPEREFDYTAGADRAIARAGTSGWTVVSVRDDWNRVF